MSECPELFKYEKPEFPEDCRYNISPSMLYQFYSNPSSWYKTTIIGEENSFHGNTATVLGTICHMIYDYASRDILGGNCKPNRLIIDKQLELYDKWRDEQGYDKIDVEDILKSYPEIVNVVVPQYIVIANDILPPRFTEKQFITHLGDGIYIGGTIDRCDVDCVVDFKTVSSKPDELIIPFNYKLQLMAYAKILRDNGYDIQRIRIVYGVKPLKKTPARCFIVTEQITQEHEELFDNTIELIKDSINLVTERPDLAYVIFRDMNLKT